MGLTSTELFTKIKSNYEANTESVIENDVNTETGVVTPSTSTKSLELEANSRQEYLAKAIADAVISEILAKGIDIGDSTATKVDVG
jgi:hypothetical protein